MSIVLLGSEKDPQILHMHAALIKANQNPLILNTQHFGNQWQISYDPDYNDGLLHFSNQRVNNKPYVPMSSITAAYWHQYIPPKSVSSPPEHTQWLEQEIASTLLCWFLFSKTKWINNIDAIRAHQCKPAQLRAANQLGANVPYTFVGNAAEVAYQFLCNMKETIYKPVKGGKSTQFIAKGLNTRHQLQSLLKERPVTLQKYIEGTNIRSYVIGSDVISVQIDSNHLDFRDDNALHPMLTPLPQAIQQLAIVLCDGLGMHWCAIDWRRTTNGQYYFLEANPCPFFLFVERETGADITGRLVALLTS